ncbi:MAG: hypothetical protein N2Z62_10750 [Rhodobacteraceae bacterium]|nr:hypothetical protein [Paracoccaceae bacterium]
MAAPPFAFDAARALVDEASALIEDARRIDAIAERTADPQARAELKEIVRTLLQRAGRISEYAGKLPASTDRSFRQKY